MKGSLCSLRQLKCTTLKEFSAAEHYADDLGMDLEDSFESDFNAKLEDGSPYEVNSLFRTV